MKVYIISHESIPVSLASTSQKAFEFTKLHTDLSCVDIHEAELDKPPERLILTGHLVYHKNMFNGNELWPDQEFRKQIILE